MKRLWLLSLAVLLLTACSSARALPDAEAEQFAASVQETSENLLLALNEQDHAAYTRDMDAQMLAVSGEEAFAQVYEGIIGKIGPYVPGSLEMDQVLVQGQYHIVIYHARFEQEEGDVTVRVVYSTGGDRPLVSGLWFDSPKLRAR
jgi:ketosteroid isomerase-like protein